MIEDEDTDDYEADINDDEVKGDRLTTKSESPRPSKIQQQGNGVMEQNTNYFDKVLKLLISERIKTTKLTAKIEQLQMQNDSGRPVSFHKKMTYLLSKLQGEVSVQKSLYPSNCPSL